MKFRSDEEILRECEELGEAAVEARLKTKYFSDNPTPAHEWLIHRQRESEHRRLQREMRNTQWALRASWVAVGISFIAVFSQMYIAQKQRNIMKEQLEQQQQYSQKQLDNAKELLGVQISVELDKQFDSSEMRKARIRFAKQLLKNDGLTEFRMLDFFDKLAMYVHNGIIDKEIASQAYSYWVIRYWPAIKPSVERFRKQERDPSFYQDVEELYVDMLKEVKKDNVPEPDEKEIQRFLREEATLPL